MRDVRPTAPAMIPTSKPRLIAMTRQVLCERAYEDSVSVTGAN